LNEPMSTGPFIQIGEVAAQTNLSLRTIRHYEEIGLVVPSGRSQGGFRLYAHRDVERLRLVRRMKPFLTLEESKDLLELLERAAGLEELAEGEHAALVDRLRMYQEAVVVQLDALREQVHKAEAFADELGDIAAQRRRPSL
jgi:DNA-binding transcriptional MerR regulator